MNQQTRQISSIVSSQKITVESSPNSRKILPRMFYSTLTADGMRNVAIIAHVDHGKTTMVDKILRECNEEVSGERVMDSNALEAERGITILSKCTSTTYKGKTINIVDTPGHADFGGEVERILTMVDSAILLVDATEGPMTQTKFVLNKALQRGFRPIVVLNKVDRETSRVDRAESEIFDLFANLGATDEQLDFPVLYASAKQGWVVKDLKDPKNSMKPLLDKIIDFVPAPKVSSPASTGFSLLVSMIEKDNYLGKMATGRIHSGRVKVGDPIYSMNLKGETLEAGKVTKILKRRGLSKIEVPEAIAGDIVTLAGISKVTVTDTVSSPDNKVPIQTNPIDPPTVTMTFSVNDSPLAGRQGNKLTSQMIRDRLLAEAEHNVSIKVQENKERSEAYDVQGRGEMQLGVLIENMRREGFELSVSPPSVVLKEENGETLEPEEEVIIEVDEQYTGAVLEKLTVRKAQILNMKPSENKKVRVEVMIPSRGLLGYRSEFMVDTRGSGIMNRIFNAYVPFKGKIEKIRKGVLVSSEIGKTTAYVLNQLEERGKLFVSPNTEVYTGMIVGENSREMDLDVNPVKEKRQTNVRTHAHDDLIQLTPPRQFSLEEALTYIEPDEVVEVTPTSIRLRKKILDPGARKRQQREDRNK